jgi:hypothetical protein
MGLVYMNERSFQAMITVSAHLELADSDHVNGVLQLQMAHLTIPGGKTNPQISRSQTSCQATCKHDPNRISLELVAIHPSHIRLS